MHFSGLYPRRRHGRAPSRPPSASGGASTPAERRSGGRCRRPSQRATIKRTGAPHCPFRTEAAGLTLLPGLVDASDRHYSATAVASIVLAPSRVKSRGLHESSEVDRAGRCGPDCAGGRFAAGRRCARGKRERELPRRLSEPTVWLRSLPRPGRDRRKRQSEREPGADGLVSRDDQVGLQLPDLLHGGHRQDDRNRRRL